MAIEQTRPSFTAQVDATVEEDADALLVGPESQTTPTLSVVMPTLNEEDGIGPCIEMIREAIAELQVPTEIIVSDSSTDGTPEIAREMGATVVVPDETGYGYAYRYAFERARGEYIAMGDADCTYDFEDIPRLFDLVADGDADVAIGSRLAGEILPGSMPTLHQYVGNPLLTRFLNTFYDAGVSDAHSGFRVFSRDALETMNLETDGMEFASEMIMDAGAKGLTIEEVPITYHPREGEANLESFSDGWRHVKFMLVNAPAYLFSIPGLLLALFGAFVMGVTGFDVPLGGVTLGAHSMIAGSLLTLVGYQVASFGVFATVASDPINAPTDPVTTWILERVQLEQGASFGVLLFGVGAAYATYLTSGWVTSGFTQLPLYTADILAFTAIVLGLQTVFGTFFLSTIAEQ